MYQSHRVYLNTNRQGINHHSDHLVYANIGRIADSTATDRCSKKYIGFSAANAQNPSPSSLYNSADCNSVVTSGA